MEPIRGYIWRKKNILILLLAISNQRQNITCEQWICQTSRQYYESSPICQTNHSWCETWRQASKQEANKTHLFVEFVIAFCLLEVMEVVELWGEVKREVVTTVVVHHLQMIRMQEREAFCRDTQDKPEVESCRTRAKQLARELPWAEPQNSLTSVKANCC